MVLPTDIKIKMQMLPTADPSVVIDAIRHEHLSMILLTDCVSIGKIRHQFLLGILSTVKSIDYELISSSEERTRENTQYQRH